MSHKSDHFCTKSGQTLFEIWSTFPQNRDCLLPPPLNYWTLHVPTVWTAHSSHRIFSLCHLLLNNLSASDRRQLRFAHGLCWRFRSSRTRRRVAGCTVTDASKDCSAFIFGVKPNSSTNILSSAPAQRWRRRRYDLPTLGKISGSHTAPRHISGSHTAPRHIPRDLNPQQSRSQNLKYRPLLISRFQQRAEIFLIMLANTCFSGGKASSAMKMRVRTYVTAVQRRMEMCGEGEISSRLNSALTWNEKRKFYLTKSSLWVAFV